jgi:glutamate synthase domain-containing protein 3
MAATDATREAVSVDLASDTVRSLNQRLHDAASPGSFRVLNPGGKHSIAAGLNHEHAVQIEGHVGYYCAGMNQRATIRVRGNCGVGVAENMMSGTVVIEKNAGSLAGAAIRGGDLVVKGDVGARTGIDQKGGTIISEGNAGLLTGFMMQRGCQIICGNVGPGLGDSMYDGAIFVGGNVKSLGVDCEEGEVTAEDTEMLDRKLGYYGIDRPDTFRKFICARKLWNYDSLEPSERKLVL